MSPHDPHEPPAERWQEFTGRWLDDIGTPSMAMLPTPHSVPQVQRIDDIVARATAAFARHADRVREAHDCALAWQAESAREAEQATGAGTESSPKPPSQAQVNVHAVAHRNAPANPHVNPRLDAHVDAHVDAHDVSRAASPPGRIDRMG